MSTAVADLRVQQSLALKVFPEQVLDAPEAARGDGGLLRVFRHNARSERFGCQRKRRRASRERAEEACEQRLCDRGCRESHLRSYRNTFFAMLRWEGQGERKSGESSMGTVDAITRGNGIGRST